MRLTEDQVKQAILHNDKEVRDAAVYYFSRSFSQDAGIMPLAIQAIDRYGWKDAFESYSFIHDLVQTDETVLWLIDQIKQIDDFEGDEEGCYANGITKGLIYADATILERHKAEIHDLTQLGDDAQFAIRQRIQFATEPPEELWDHLTFCCNRYDKLEMIPDDLDAGYYLAEALGRHPEFTLHKILPILNGETGDEGNWIELFAVRIAGELKLHTAVAQVIRLLETDDDWIPEEGHWALVKIGGDGVVEELAEAYAAGSSDIRLSVASILENLHTDLCVQTCLRLFETEEDDYLRGHLLQSVLMNFSADGIEPARQYLLEISLDPDVLEVRHALLVACKMMGETFPEFDAWTEDSKNDTEFRKNWYRSHPFIPTLLDIEEDFDEDDEFDDDEEDEPVVPADTIIREVRVGRNDPCPCGSGMKFKKCCLGKRSGV